MDVNIGDVSVRSGILFYMSRRSATSEREPSAADGPSFCAPPPPPEAALVVRGGR